MRRTRFLLPMAACLLVGAPAQSAEVPISEKTYPVRGSTALEIYRSIAENGPAGGAHLAQTTFTLTWNRLFDERGGDCYLVHARPKLAITHSYPKPAGKLSPSLQRHWDKLIAATRRHEETHARMIKDMVAKAEAEMAGMMEKNDRSCAKIKKSVSARIDAAYQAHRDRSRAFDRSEMAQGGPMFIVLENFVNER